MQLRVRQIFDRLLVRSGPGSLIVQGAEQGVMRATVLRSTQLIIRGMVVGRSELPRHICSCILVRYLTGCVCAEGQGHTQERPRKAFFAILYDTVLY